MLAKLHRASELTAVWVRAAPPGAVRGSGVSIGPAAGQIAAIVLAHGAPIATRTRKSFEALGLDVIDPWRFEG